MKERFEPMKQSNVRSLVFAAMMAAVIVVCAWIAIPLPGNLVPISLATFAVMMSGLLLGWKWGGAAVAVYILLGAVGLPVFAKFQSGIGTLLGATGGYIVGYLPCAMLAGLPVKGLQKNYGGRIVLLLAGTIVCYALGTVWFMHVTARSLAESLGLCVLPFLPGDAAKILLSAALAPALRKAMKV